MIGARFKYCIALVCLTLLIAAPSAESAKPKPAASTPSSHHEATIEEVTSKNLERILLEKDYVAVYWCKNLPDFSNKG